jgi:hypothetical protein
MFLIIMVFLYTLSPKAYVIFTLKTFLLLTLVLLPGQDQGMEGMVPSTLTHWFYRFHWPQCLQLVQWLSRAAAH